jgi:hypothetical protein
MSNFTLWSIANIYYLLHRSTNTIVFSIFFILFFSTSLAKANEYNIGVFYFPGWKDKQPHAPAPYPWARLKMYPERKPMLGWYDEGNDLVMEQQLDWMQKYGIDFIVFDWYYGPERQIYLEQALAAYIRAPNREKVKFSILWANHDTMPKSKDDWLAMVRYWVKYYFKRPEYLKSDGKPVVYIFSADDLKKKAESFGLTSKDLLESAQALAKENGLLGINFIAGAGAYVPMITSYARDSGYTGFSAYNYHQGPNEQKQSHSYAELDLGYRAHWKRFSEKSTLPLIVPMTSGWDKRPWGGSKDAAHDNSLSTPQEFRKHLEAARQFMDANPLLTKKMGVICCWNEFGEGSYIEPTENGGFSYLEQVKQVFRNTK